MVMIVVVVVEEEGLEGLERGGSVGEALEEGEMVKAPLEEKRWEG